jgi:DNA-binding HxlR family transcriptional regulator
VSKFQNQSNTYTKFLKLVQAIRDLPTFPALDPVEERLLNQLAGKWHVGEEVTVLQAMQMSPDVSSATVHRRLKTLRQKGMLTLTGHETDNRIRYIAPTELTNKYFAKMGQCLDMALRD